MLSKKRFLSNGRSDFTTESFATTTNLKSKTITSKTTSLIGKTMNIIPPSPCRDASMQHAIKRIDTSQKNNNTFSISMRRVNVCLFLQDTLTRLYKFPTFNIFNFQFKKGVTLIRATPQLCIMNYELCIKPRASLLF